jgi:hypothetical protein
VLSDSSFRPVHIILSLRCGEQKRQNPPREVLANRSGDFGVAAAAPIEGVFINLQNKLPKGDPGRDLLVGTFEGYQQTAGGMVAYEQGKGQRPDVLLIAAELRKGLLTKVLEGNMTASEKELYKAWLQGHP